MSDRQSIDVRISTIVRFMQGTIELAPTRSPSGTIVLMGNEQLIARIEARLQELKVSERKLLLNHGLDLATIRRIRSRGQIPGSAILSKLEAALKVAPGYLFEVVSDRPTSPVGVPLDTILVRGEVQAGVWRTAVEWDHSDWFPITVPADPRYAAHPRFALLIRGDSMNRLYPDGTIVVAVRFYDLNRSPVSGERVVTLRRMLQSDAYEATVKEYERDKQGRHLLWPRSTDPDFQAPLVLAHLPIPCPDGTIHDESGNAIERHAAAGEPDIVITALIIGSYRPEGPML